MWASGAGPHPLGLGLKQAWRPTTCCKCVCVLGPGTPTHLEHLGPALPGLGDVLGVALACGGGHAVQEAQQQPIRVSCGWQHAHKLGNLKDKRGWQ